MGVDARNYEKFFKIEILLPQRFTKVQYMQHTWMEDVIAVRCECSSFGNDHPFGIEFYCFKRNNGELAKDSRKLFSKQ